MTEIKNFPCKITSHPRHNFSKELVYIYESDIENIEDFTEYMTETYNTVNVQHAAFIKTRNPQTKAFIIIFSGDRIPYTLYIPGERQDTEVYRFKSKPIMCNNCQGYGHPKKWCRNNVVCRKCAMVEHGIE